MYVSIVAIRAIAEELKKRHIDPVHLLDDVGIDSRILEDLLAMVDPDVLERIVLRALEVSGEPALGLCVGANASESTMQIVGPLMFASPNLREAIRVFRRFAPLFAVGVEWCFEEGPVSTQFGFRLGQPPGDATRYFNEYLCTFAARVGRHFHENDRARMSEVCFAHIEPSYAALYERMFACPVRFSADQTGITFPTKRLDIPQIHADPITCAILGEVAERLLREREGSTTAERVRMILKYQTDFRGVGAPRVAHTFGLSLRSLSRRLRGEGTSITAIIEEERMRAACLKLRSSNLTIKQIGDWLGYTGTSAFHRAFKRWSGLTPQQYGKQRMERQDSRSRHDA